MEIDKREVYYSDYESDEDYDELDICPRCDNPGFLLDEGLDGICTSCWLSDDLDNWEYICENTFKCLNFGCNRDILGKGYYYCDGYDCRRSIDLPPLPPRHIEEWESKLTYFVDLEESEMEEEEDIRPLPPPTSWLEAIKRNI